MKSGTKARVARTTGWSALGAAAAALSGSTPIGIAIVAALAATLAWWTRAGARREPR